MDIPRAEWPKLGVFLHPKILKKVHALAKKEKLSATRFIEKLVELELKLIGKW